MNQTPYQVYAESLVALPTEHGKDGVISWRLHSRHSALRHAD